MPERSLRVRGADVDVLAALLDLVSDYYRVDISMFKPRFSRTVEVRISGPDPARVEKAYADIAKFASKMGWRIE